MKLFLLTFLWLSQVDAESLFRVIVPEVQTLEGVNKKEGELVFDSNSKKLKAYIGDKFRFITKKSNVKEEFPEINKILGDNFLTVGPGRVMIGDRIYSNQSAITCSYLNQGIGGYDVDIPGTNLFDYLYLVPHPTVEDSFTCIISHNSESPVSINTSSRRLLSFYANASFSSYKGSTDYQFPYITLHSIPEMASNECSSIASHSIIPAHVIEAIVIVECSVGSIGDIYDMPSCDSGNWFGQCVFQTVYVRLLNLLDKTLHFSRFTNGGSVKIAATMEDI